MLKRIMSTAIIAGLVAGILVSVVHEFTTTPIILYAEEYENSGENHHTLLQDATQGGVKKANVHSDTQGQIYLADTDSEDGQEEWGPNNRLERTFFTSLANILTGVGFAAILVACFTFSGEKLSGRRGVIWGLAGFAVFTLAPSLGLPPEVPGSMAADLSLRQTWWIATSVATGVGLWVMIFGSKTPIYLLGLLLIILPHVIGAPQPTEIGGNAPPELAGQFVAASIVVSAIFWVILGWTSGALWKHSGDVAK
ncbi:CbtA family protein [Kiloniella antarctica]|uniref:CbtA family protein n=1 Tax=Kiloniella antarctica TaxID=1550907 RepID=A0ABW5BNB4_9PROT